MLATEPVDPGWPEGKSVTAAGAKTPGEHSSRQENLEALPPRPRLVLLGAPSAEIAEHAPRARKAARFRRGGCRGLEAADSAGEDGEQA